MSTIRFRDLVKTAGTPEPKSLWADPKADRDFKRAVKQNRVLTVVQESKKKDFGELGFHPHPSALYFIFPKPLPAEGGRVIGINYDLVEVGEPTDVISPAELNRAAKTKHTRPREQEKIFQIAVRRIATIETSMTMGARSKAEALAKAAERLNKAGVDLSKAQIKNEIRSVK